MRALIIGLLLGLAAATPALACRNTAGFDDLEDAWREKRAPSGPVHWMGWCRDDTTLRNDFLENTASDLGPRIGYKAGLTTAAAQERFATDAPLLGVLYRSMILSDGAEVDAGFGARPLWEADFLLVVGDDALNEAKTREEALAHLRGFRPFIELPDLLYSAETRVTARLLAIINVGARFGVAGEERPLPRDALTSLATMRVRAFDGSGALLAEGKGSDALGHPLDVVLWVRDAVHREGGRLKAGDVISVGAFTPLTPPKAGQTIRVRYEGLAGDPEVSVRFR